MSRGNCSVLLFSKIGTPRLFKENAAHGKQGGIGSVRTA